MAITFSKLAAELWRDFATDGVVSSGAHNPIKTDIRVWGKTVEDALNDHDTDIASNTTTGSNNSASITSIGTRVTALETTQDGGGLAYSTKAELDADLDHDANQKAEVFADSTSSNNGVYKKTGASGSGSWTKVSDLAETTLSNLVDVLMATAVGGTANAVTLTTRKGLTGLTEPILVGWKQASLSTSATVTLTVDSAPATNLKDGSGGSLSSGDLKVGEFYQAYYNGAEFRLVSSGIDEDEFGDVFRTLMLVQSVDSFTGGTGTNNGAYDSGTGTFTLADNTFGGMTLTGLTLTNGQLALLRMDKTEGQAGVAFEVQLRAGGSTVQTYDLGSIDGAEDLSVQITAGQAIDEIRIYATTQGGSTSAISINNFRFYKDVHSEPIFLIIPSIIQTELDSLDTRIDVLEADNTTNKASISTQGTRISSLESFKIGVVALAQMQSLAMQNPRFGHPNGDDTNAGSESAPYQTLDKLTEIHDSSDTDIVLAADAEFSAYREEELNSCHITGYPNSAKNPKLVDLVDLSSNTWTNDSGNIWTTTLTLSSAPATNKLNGSDPDSFHFGLFLGDTLLDHVVGEANIAANKTAMTAGTFTAHFTGSTVEDIRSDTAGTSTGVTVFVWMADDSNPNGQALRATDYRPFPAPLDDYMHGGSICNVDSGMNWTKDNLHFAVDTLGRPTTVGDMKVHHAPQHGFVGPCHIAGKYTFVGRGVPGASGYESGNSTKIRRAAGGCNIYTDVHYSSLDLFFNELELTNAGSAFYGHGAGSNAGYRNITIRKMIVNNCSTALKFDELNTDSKFIDEGVTIDLVEATNADNAFQSASVTLDVNGGFVTFSTDDFHLGSPRQVLVAFSTIENQTATIKNLDITFPRTYTAFSTENLLFRVLNDPTSGNHTLVLDNVQDLSDDTKKAHFPRGGGVTHKVKLVIKGGTTLGDLQPRSSDNIWPAELEVEAGTTFGFAGRDFATLVSDLDAAGITHNLDSLTASDVTLVAARTV